jgi:hypothetical protein
LVSPHIPQGVALLGEFRQLVPLLRHAMRIDVATQGAPGGKDLFSYNQFQLRGETRSVLVCCGHRRSASPI